MICVYVLCVDGWCTHTQRNSSFALATLAADRFAGLKGSGTLAETKLVKVTGSKMTITADVGSGGSVTVGVVGHGGAASQPITKTVTDGEVTGLQLDGLVGKEVQLTITLKDATVYTIGFSAK